MDERLTKPASESVDLARKEARLLGSLDVGPEHLLLGLLREERGVGSRALLTTGLTVTRARELARERAEVLPKEDSERAEPELSPRVKRTIQHAQPEAWRLGAAKAGTEHLLLTLLSNPDGTVVEMLVAEDINPEELKREVRRMAEEGQNDGITAGELREETQRLRQAADAMNEATSRSSFWKIMLPGFITALTMGAAVGVGVYTAIRLARKKD